MLRYFRVRDYDVVFSHLCVIGHTLGHHGPPVARQPCNEEQRFSITTSFDILVLLWDCDGTTLKDVVMVNQKKIVVSYCGIVM